MKTTLTILLIVFCSFVFGQKINPLKPCDTSKLSFFTVNTIPCLVPVINAGKLTGYTEQIFRSYPTSASRLYRLSDFLIGNTKPSFYKWIIFEYPDRPQWSIDDPDTTKGKYIIHIKRKYVHWLNDSTMVYSYPKK
jgi:hypothetical protein